MAHRISAMRHVERTTTTDHTMTTADRPEPPPLPLGIQSGKFPTSAMEGKPLELWKPTRAQVFAAARAFARMTDAEWRALGDTQRADYLIDAARALVEARKLEPVTVATRGPVDRGDTMVCMTKEHADLYAELVVATDHILALSPILDVPAKLLARERINRVMERLRALTSPERATP